MSWVSRQLVKVLRNRPHAQGAEVGVFQGDTSAGLLAALPDLESLLCIDLWRQDEAFMRHSPNKQGVMYNADWAAVRRQFAAQVEAVYPGRAQAIQMSSLEAARYVRNGSLDFVLIDGNHGYEFVKPDIQAWWPKIKDGGVMAGDDYCGRRKPTYGVIRAVDELFNGHHKNKGRMWWTLKTEEWI